MPWIKCTVHREGGFRCGSERVRAQGRGQDSKAGSNNQTPQQRAFRGQQRLHRFRSVGELGEGANAHDTPDNSVKIQLAVKPLKNQTKIIKMGDMGVSPPKVSPPQSGMHETAAGFGLLTLSALRKTLVFIEYYQKTVARILKTQNPDARFFLQSLLFCQIFPVA